jgi:Lon-like ATP-dependent protease
MSNDPSAAETVLDVDEWIESQGFQTTADVKIPDKLADQVIGQDAAVEVIRKAAEQKRHVMLIGEPGTGKSMLAKSMTEYLPKGELQDVIAYHNADDPNEPKIRIVPAGKGKEIVTAQKKEAMVKKQQKGTMITFIIFMVLLVTFALFFTVEQDANIILIGIIVVAILFFATRYSGTKQENYLVPKLLVTHEDGDQPPFIDATGAHAGALLGDVKHDPFQSGGLETPAHERLEVGAIHKASKGVLFIDEINMLRKPAEPADRSPGGQVLHHRTERKVVRGDGEVRARSL